MQQKTQTNEHQLIRKMKQLKGTARNLFELSLEAEIKLVFSIIFEKTWLEYLISWLCFTLALSYGVRFQQAAR